MLKDDFLKVTIYPIICLLYASFLTSFPSEMFRDRLAYFRYAEKGIDVFSVYDYDILKIMFNEPIFLFVNEILGYFMTPANIVSSIVFFICFSFSYFICFNARNVQCAILGLLLLFFIPQSFHAQLVILRQSLAVSFFLWSMICFENKKYIFISSCVCCFIHSSFFIITPLLFFVLFIEYDKRYKYFLAPIIYAVLVSFSGLFLAELFGLRQAVQNQSFASGNISVSGMAFLLWSAAIFILMSRSRKLNNNVLLLKITISFLIFYCSLYFLSPISGRVFSVVSTMAIASLVRTYQSKNILYVFILLVISLLTFEQSVTGNSFL